MIVRWAQRGEERPFTPSSTAPGTVCAEPLLPLCGYRTTWHLKPQDKTQPGPNSMVILDSSPPFTKTWTGLDPTHEHQASAAGNARMGAGTSICFGC